MEIETQSLILTPYDNFVYALKAHETKRQYPHRLDKFLTFMKAKGKGYSSIHNYVAAILAFYKINDVILNVTKISRFIPLQMKLKKDRAYTHEEISKFLEIGEERMRAIILLLASSGMRLGVLPLIRLRNLESQDGPEN